jgi:DNA polymerase-3 subunit delta
MIENELNKFFIYEPEHKNIGIKDLDILITNNVQSNIFNLLDNMFIDQGRMLKALENLFKLKEPEIKIVFMIIRELRIILRTKWFLKEKYSEEKIAAILELPHFAAEKKVKLSKRMTFEEIFKYLKLFYEVEEKIKSGYGDGKMLLRSTLLSIK